MTPWGDLGDRHQAPAALPPAVELAALIAAGTTAAELASRYGCARSTVIKRLAAAGYSARTGIPRRSQRGGSAESRWLFKPEPWTDAALCTQTDPEAFFPDKGGSTREAKRVCLACEVRGECLEYALEHDERFGIWGGLSERERRKLKRRRT